LRIAVIVPSYSYGVPMPNMRSVFAPHNYHMSSPYYVSSPSYNYGYHM